MSILIRRMQLPLHLYTQQPLEKKTLAQWRLTKRWTQAQLAARAQVALITIYRAEQDKPVSDLVIGRLADALGIREEQLLIARVKKGESV